MRNTLETFGGESVMNNGPDSSAQPSGGGSPSTKWKLFLGLSRTPHGILDLATPAMAALLWLGHFPPFPVVLVGLITAFAGYTAVYALNDLVDYRVDDERLRLREEVKDHFHVDEILVRHPIAQGLLSYRSSVAWCGFWAVVAAIGAWWLNPFCVVIFAISGAMEWLYCKLLRITHLKIIPSAIVKASGGLAGVYAVDPSPSLGFVVVLFIWLAAWEVGGQNVANDIVDVDDDARVYAKTTATVMGITAALFVLLVAVSMAAFGGVTIYWLSGLGPGILYLIGSAVLAWKLLLEPARQVYMDPGAKTAASLFNKASYVPGAFLILTLLCICIPV